MAKYQMGPTTLAVPMELFKENRAKLVNRLKEHQSIDANTYILMQGGKEIDHYNTDVNYLFRQEPFFFYLFGVTEPEFYGIVNAKTGATTLFMPRLSEEYEVWMGKLKAPEDFRTKYDVDEVYYNDDLDKIIAQKSTSLLLTMSGRNSDSGLVFQPPVFDGIEKYITNCDLLYDIISECRVLKSEKEIEVLRYVTQISCDAHREVMKQIKLGQTEYQCESVFLHHTYFVGGSRHTSYTCICGVGTNSSILHYGHAAAPNDVVIRDGDMCLFDMGANYCGYAADITCSFPANGKFTEDQKIIYNAVLAANKAVLDTMKHGVSWVEMHKLANRVMLQHLKTAGLLKGEIDAMMEAGINGVFQPHGLGHLIGIDVHDVGGYLEHCPPRPTEPGINRLRFARDLEAGMVVTVEPGCYFIDRLLDAAIADPVKSQFLNVNVINRFRNFGGIRIEDDVFVTTDGCENLSHDLPRTVEQIELFMATGSY